MSTQKNQKGFAPILIVIAIVVIAILTGAVYLGKQANKLADSSPKPTSQPSPSPIPPTTTPQIPTLTPIPNPTANWTLYTNNKYHYQFKYPPEWFIFESSPDNQGLYESPVTTDIDKLNFIIGFSVLDSKYIQLGPSNPVGTRKETGDKIFEENIGNITINNIPAIKYKIDVLPGSQTDARPVTGIRLNFDSKTLSIFLPKFYEKYTDRFDQILSTFKFSVN